MERRFEAHLRRMVKEAVVEPGLLHGMLKRLERFVEPFARSLKRAEQRRHAHEYVAGLLSGVERKNVEAIAYLHDQDRQPLQKFVGQASWDPRPLVEELVRQVARELGEADAVLVFDPSAFPKKGGDSVGVDRQWCGRLGKIDNCQVALYLAYAARREHALVDTRLYLPESWAQDRQRRRKAGVPRSVRFATRHALALEMLAEHGAQLPHGWIAGDDEMGRAIAFRRELDARGERYLLAVPSTTLVRDLAAPAPAYAGQGRPRKAPFVRADRWGEALPPEAWATIEVRDGERGPLAVEAVHARMQAHTRPPHKPADETLVVLRERQADGTLKHDYYLSNAAADTPLSELARVAKAEHRVEEGLQRAKSEAGLGDYQVRGWRAWHHHQILSLVAAWFLIQEKRRGEKNHPGAHGAVCACDHRLLAPAPSAVRSPGPDLPAHDTPPAAQRASPLLPSPAM